RARRIAACRDSLPRFPFHTVTYQMLDKLFNPSAIAIIGASKDTRRPGGQPLYALTHYGYRGPVYAVNPRYTEINGTPCFPDVKSTPGPSDLAIIALPAWWVSAALRACGEA